MDTSPLHMTNAAASAVLVLLLIGTSQMTTSLFAAPSASEPDAETEAESVAAQGRRATPAPRSEPDFLFGRPVATLGVRGQWVLARADSEIFRFVGERLSPISEARKPASDRRPVSGRDFNAPGVAVDVGIPLTPRFDLVAGLETSRTSIPSSFRSFSETVDGAELEIEQTTSSTQFVLSGSVEMALTPRGRAVGQYAWIPARATPYVGAGIGALWHRFEQNGDFVDETDNSIFGAQLRSEGWTPETHVFGGVDVRLSNRVQLTFEGRYLWAAASMSQDFVDFDEIDLAGLRVTTGIQFSF